MLTYRYNDGGRSQYFKAENVCDCCVRAFAIASKKDYKEIYNLFKKTMGSTPRNGVPTHFIKKVAQILGAKWVSEMGRGTGCQCHLREYEIPMHGRIVCRVSKHLVAVINGVINGTYDPSRGGYRCVYGYWVFS